MTNTLILMSDEHNPFYSSVYHHPFVKTPHMQKLAQRGTLFKNAYCPSPLCLPSRSSFLSGKRVHELQTYSNCDLDLDPSPESYGACLDRQGVHSVHIGKTHFYDHGDNLGFSEMILPRELVSDTYHQRNPMRIREGAHKRCNSYGPREGAGDADLECIDTAVAWLRNQRKKVSHPWVLTVNIVNPHFPHFVIPELWEMYAGCEDLPQYSMDCESAQHPYAQAQRRHFQVEGFNEEQIRGLRRGYYGCVTFVDQQLGKLMETLETEGVSDETNLIYVTDHGELLGKFGMWWKCSLIEDSVRIPCIAAGPHFQSGRVVETPVDLHDVQAFLFEASGASRPSDWVGTPLNRIPQNDPNRVVFSEYHGHGNPGSSYMIRKGPWKYIHYMNAPNQLFNLETDPDELKNIITHHPAIAEDLWSELLRICNPLKEHQKAEVFIETQIAKIEGMASFFPDHRSGS